MPEQPTLQSLLALPAAEQDKKIRQLCTGALEPGPWRHEERVYSLDGSCVRCGLSGVFQNAVSCPIPPEATGSFSDLAELMRLPAMEQEVESSAVTKAAIIIANMSSDLTVDEDDWLCWWAFESTARERVICLLMALGKLKA